MAKGDDLAEVEEIDLSAGTLPPPAVGRDTRDFSVARDHMLSRGDGGLRVQHASPARPDAVLASLIVMWNGLSRINSSNLFRDPCSRRPAVTPA